MNITPQAGPQLDFLSSSAHIAIYGGAAGSGKSFALLLEPLRHYTNSKFGGVIFRKNSTQIRNEGGLLDESMELYAPLGGVLRESFLEWTFPSGARVKFAHIDTEKDVYSWQGSQIAFIGFDELVHFSESQFFYMLSRNRSTSGVPGYVRATCNPDADSWVRHLIDWWIGPGGYPIKERSGVLRWFIRIDNTIIWANTPEELIAKHGPETMPKSLTFIMATIHDNKILLEKDPSYLANLHALTRVERMRLLGGNWDVKYSAGSLFQREWFPILDAIPAGWIQSIRFWDRAATKPNEVNRDPDWTRGLKLYKYRDGSFLVADLKSIRDTPGEVEKLIKNTASHDSQSCRIMSQQDPGSAGVMEKEHFVRMLAGYDVRTVVISKDKITRAKSVSAQCQVGNIRVLRAPWNNEFFSECENFPEGGHDDIVDVLSGAFNELSNGMSIMDVL